MTVSVKKEEELRNLLKSIQVVTIITIIHVTTVILMHILSSFPPLAFII